MNECEQERKSKINVDLKMRQHGCLSYVDILLRFKSQLCLFLPMLKPLCPSSLISIMGKRILPTPYDSYGD